jgi:hypothetical protein
MKRRFVPNVPVGIPLKAMIPDAKNTHPGYRFYIGEEDSREITRIII